MTIAPEQITPELMREYSARGLARLVGRDVRSIIDDLEQIPAAVRSPGGNWRCPLWAYYQYQLERGQ